MTTTGQRFKKIRNELRLSQDAFGEKIGLSKSGISAVENDKSFISIEIMRSLFIDFDINLNYLICGKGNMFNSSQFEQVQDEFAQKVKAILKDEGLIG